MVKTNIEHDNIDKADFLDSVAYFVSECTESIYTVVINFEVSANRIACHNFDPKTNPDHLPIFVAMMVSATQTAIDESGGKDQIIIKKPDGEMINMAERMHEMQEMLDKGLN